MCYSRNRLKFSKLSIDRSGAGESDQPSSSKSCDRRTGDSHHEPSGVRTGQDHHGSVSAGLIVNLLFSIDFFLNWKMLLFKTIFLSLLRIQALIMKKTTSESKILGLSPIQRCHWRLIKMPEWFISLQEILILAQKMYRVYFKNFWKKRGDL